VPSRADLEPFFLLDDADKALIGIQQGVARVAGPYR